MPAPVGDRLRRQLIAARAAAVPVWRDWQADAPARRMRDGWAQAVDADAAADHAHALLSDEAWIAALFAPLVAALGTDPLFDPPFRVNRTGGRIGMLVHECPVASLTASLLAVDAMRASPPPDTVVVAGRMSVMRVHAAGGACLHRWRASRVDGDFSLRASACAERLPSVALADGDVHRIDGRTDAIQFDGAVRDVVTLTATIRLDAAPVMREYAREDGRPLRAATLDEQAARSQMLLTLLRAAPPGGTNAAFEAATRDPAFFVRWDAMRQWLSLDADAAAPRLAEMAMGDPNADIRDAAAATLGQVERLRRQRRAA